MSKEIIVRCDMCKDLVHGAYYKILLSIGNTNPKYDSKDLQELYFDNLECLAKFFNDKYAKHAKDLPKKGEWY